MDLNTKLDEKLAVCPFFKNHKLMCIDCEGVIPDTYDVIRFQTSLERKKQFDIYCCCQYQKCERYMTINKRYNEE